MDEHIFLRSASLGWAQDLNSRLEGTKRFVEETTAKIDKLLLP